MGSVRECQTQYEKLLAKVGYLPPNRQVSCFIGSLEDSIKTDVLVGCPTTISSAISHRCKKFFFIELCEEEGDSNIVIEGEDTEQTTLNNLPEISLHVISGLRASETMRVRGNIWRLSIIVLVDSGSTHNFIIEVLAKKFGLQPMQEGKFEVLVTFGERLSSQGKSKNVKLLLQGIPIVADFYLLPLEGYEIVLGTQWLQTLGPIV
ncbi:hypothetical protein JRO89_XS07G0145600 [Xanthoceras sorbifolium]|uniref:RVP_2 domain-containing protein n=1 Tax=Xanthoceras sorbifolium TaxID=99658 RepID=A0ABQ8HTX2_9ROSI|nr:hypothetical protein JRO89_XS07G0145600 [Xanthoceras sorbifolium]